MHGAISKKACSLAHVCGSLIGWPVHMSPAKRASLLLHTFAIAPPRPAFNTLTHTQVIMSSPPSSALSPTSPRRGSLGRRASNPFTRNQDLAEEGGAAPDASSMISSFRNASLGRRSSSSHEQTIDEGGSDEDLEPAVIQPPQSSALGAGTGVSAPASATTPAGLPLAPSLDPAGGSQRQVRPGLVSTSSEAYSSSNEAPAAAKTESAPRGTGRSRGIVRTYSMVRS